MRVALCLSGLTRSLEWYYILAKHYIIDPLNCDIFLHTWEQDHGGHRCIWEPNVQHQKSSFIKAKRDFVEHVIAPKKYIIEDYSIFEQENGNNISHAMYYSIYNANKLKRQYEEEHNIKYDLVIRSRMDIFHTMPIPEYELTNTNAIYVACGMMPEIYPHKEITDIFAFGSSENMNIYSDSVMAWQNDKTLRSEQVLDTHLKQNNIKHKWSNIKFYMLEKYTINEVRLNYYT